MNTFSHESLSPELIHLLVHDERTPAHTHDLGHLVYPATGVLSLVTSDGSWIAPSNRVVWVPADFEHQHRAHGAADMRVGRPRACPRPHAPCADFEHQHRAHGAADMRVVFLPAQLAAALVDRPAVLAT